MGPPEEDPSLNSPLPQNSLLTCRN